MAGTLGSKLKAIRFALNKATPDAPRVKTNAAGEAKFTNRTPKKVKYDSPAQMIPPGEPITAAALAKAKGEFAAMKKGKKPDSVALPRPKGAPKNAAL